MLTQRIAQGLNPLLPADSIADQGKSNYLFALTSLFGKDKD